MVRQIQKNRVWAPAGAILDLLSSAVRPGTAVVKPAASIACADYEETIQILGLLSCWPNSSILDPPLQTTSSVMLFHMFVYNCLRIPTNIEPWSSWLLAHRPQIMY